MKRAFAIAALSILLVNSAGFYVYYVVQLRQIRAEMRETLKHLPEDQLEVLIFTQEEYKQCRVDEHEVKVNGRMYDIARISRDGNRIIVHALHDVKEDNVLTLISEIISRPMKDKHSMPVSILEFLTLTFIPPSNELTYPGVTLCDHFNTHYRFSVKDAHSVPDSPPPKILCRSIKTLAPAA